MYRMKGVMNIANADSRFMFQAVHMVGRCTFLTPPNPYIFVAERHLVSTLAPIK
jgi:hypothetical protein